MVQTFELIFCLVPHVFNNTYPICKMSVRCLLEILGKDLSEPLYSLALSVLRIFY